MITTLLLSTALAAPGDSDVPDDIFGDDTATPQPTVGEEKRALREDEPEVALPDEAKKKRVIQTFQRKNFMKIGRYEASPYVGFVTNDPFIHRYMVGAGFAYHVTEIFAVEVNGFFAPDLGNEIDYKAITKQIITFNQVTPDISKINFALSGDVQFSPIYGKLAVGQGDIIGFDIFGVFGTGAVYTVDDLAALQKTDDPVAQASESQFHPTINFGGGARVILSDSFAFRVEGRGLSYIEVIESTTLEMKNNFTLLASASFFFPGMK